MGYEGTEDVTAGLCHAERRGEKSRRRTCTTDVRAARACTNNSAIAKRAFRPSVLRRREHRTRDRNSAQRFKLADVSCSTFNGQTKRTEVNVRTARENAATLNFGDEAGARAKHVNAVRRT